MRRRIRSLQPTHVTLLVGLVILASGCIHTDLRVENQGGIAPTGRVLWQAVEAGGERQGFFRTSGVSLEGDVSYAEGKARDDNGIQASERVVVGKTSIPGAGGVNAKAELVDVKGTVRSGFQLGTVFRLESMIGVEAVSLDFRVSGSTSQASSTNQAAGFLWGFRAGLQPHRMVEVYGRVLNGILGGSSLRVDSAYTFHAEAGLRVAPVDLISLFAGYRWTEYHFQIDKEQTDLDIGLDGPVLGLELRF